MARPPRTAVARTRTSTQSREVGEEERKGWWYRPRPSTREEEAVATPCNMVGHKTNSVDHLERGEQEGGLQPGEEEEYTLDTCVTWV